MRLKVVKGQDLNKVLGETNEFLGTLKKGQWANTIINPNLTDTVNIQKTHKEANGDKIITTVNKYSYDYVSITYHLDPSELEDEPVSRPRHNLSN